MWLLILSYRKGKHGEKNFLSSARAFKLRNTDVPRRMINDVDYSCFIVSGFLYALVTGRAARIEPLS